MISDLLIQILARIGGRDVGFLFAVQHKDIATTLYEPCDAILAAQDPQDLSALLLALGPQGGKPLETLAFMTISDVLSIVEVVYDAPILKSSKVAAIKAAVSGFEQGLMLAGVQRPNPPPSA